MLGRRLFTTGLGAALCGCGGAVRPQPPPPAQDVARAAGEIEAAPFVRRQVLAGRDMGATLRRINARLDGPAQALCREIGRNACDWHLRTARSRQVNAQARGDGSVVINRGIFDYAGDEAQVAFVVAHEMAHHAADHIARTGETMEVGAAIGAVAMSAVVVAGALAGGRSSAASNRRSIESSGRFGASLGRIAFSKEQEREADHLGAILLFRAGYDLDAARGFLVTMALLSARRETGLFDSHPAGPERIAAFDRSVAQLRAANGQLPVRPEA